MSAEQFGELIKEFATHVGIEDTDEIETTSIVTIDDVDVEIIYREDEEEGVDEVIIMASLGTPAPGHELVIYRALLEGNLLGAGTGGGHLAVNPESGEAMASVTALIDELDGESLAEALDGFVDIVNFWRELISAASDPQFVGEGDVPEMSGHITP